MKVYLCGPINNCTDNECRDWRDNIKLYLKDTIDPMRRDYRGNEHQHIDDIVELDKIDVCNSDALIVNYVKPSVGTSMEILYAWERGKFIIVVHNESTSLSPWLVYHSHRTVTSFDQAIAIIQNLDI